MKKNKCFVVLLAFMFLLSIFMLVACDSSTSKNANLYVVFSERASNQEYTMTSPGVKKISCDYKEEGYRFYGASFYASTGNPAEYSERVHWVEPGKYSLTVTHYTGNGDETKEYTLEVTIREKPDTRVLPKVVVNQQDAIEFDENKSYVFEYNNGNPIALAFDVVGKGNEPLRVLESSTIYTNEKDETYEIIAAIGTYTAVYTAIKYYSIDEELYLPTTITIEVKIIEPKAFVSATEVGINDKLSETSSVEIRYYKVTAPLSGKYTFSITATYFSTMFLFDENFNYVDEGTTKSESTFVNGVQIMTSSYEVIEYEATVFYFKVFHDNKGSDKPIEISVKFSTASVSVGDNDVNLSYNKIFAFVSPITAMYNFITDGSPCVLMDDKFTEISSTNSYFLATKTYYINFTGDSSGIANLTISPVFTSLEHRKKYDGEIAPHNLIKFTTLSLSNETYEIKGISSYTIYDAKTCSAMPSMDATLTSLNKSTDYYLYFEESSVTTSASIEYIFAPFVIVPCEDMGFSIDKPKTFSFNPTAQTKFEVSTEIWQGSITIELYDSNFELVASSLDGSLIHEVEPGNYYIKIHTTSPTLVKLKELVAQANE